MKTMKKIFATLLLTASLVFAYESQAQSGGLAAQPIPVAEFSIEIEFDKEEAELSCEEGCYWTEIEFKLDIGKRIYVSPIGISPKQLEEKQLDFQFLLKRTDKNTVLLTKVKGMAWKQLEGTAESKKSLKVSHTGIVIPE